MDLFAGVLPLVTVADTGSFRAAARALGVTPSAISKAIARLERELGVRLIHRTSRVMTITAEGAEVVAGFREAVERVRAARDAAVDAQRTPSGRLRVTWPLVMASFFAERVVPRLVERHPRVEVQALITDRVLDLAAENIDLAIRIGDLSDSTLIARRLGAIRWVTVASPDYLARHGTPHHPGELAEHRCLRFVVPSGRIKEWVFQREGQTVDVMPSGPFTADHGGALVAAALAGAGIVQAQNVMVSHHIATGALVEVLSDHRAPGPPIQALTGPGRKASAKLRAFVELVEEELGAELARPVLEHAA